MQDQQQQQDSCSMTPPHSPLVAVPMEIEQADEIEQLKTVSEAVSGVALFTCQGEVEVLKPAKLHWDGPMRQDVLKRLYKGLQSTNDLTVELFGCPFTAHLALQEDMDRLFYTARKFLTKLEMSAEGVFGYIPSEVWQEKTRYRTQMKEFFTYIQTYLIHYMPVQQDSAYEVLHHLTDHIKSLLLFMGQLYELPPHTLATCASIHGNQCSSGGYHVYHQYLDLLLVVMETLYTIHNKYPDFKANYELYKLQEGDTSDLLTQCTHLLLWDIVTLALPRFNKVMHGDYTKHSPFLCNCSKELVAMVIHLSQHRFEHSNKESFWSSLSGILKRVIQGNNVQSDTDQEIDSDMFVVPPVEFECKDPTGFTWWILLHVAPLFGFDAQGNYDSKNIQGPSRSNCSLVVLLLKTLLKGQVSESQLRSSLRNCVHLTKLWESNTEILIVLWEFFFKRLNEQFLLPRAGLAGFANQSTSANSLLEKCEKWINGDMTKLHEENSFELFVRLLCDHLGRNREGASGRPAGITQEWKQMKGRIYMKFHARRMQEMTDVGLHNFSCLFISLAAVADLQDVGGKMVDLLSLLDNLTVEKRMSVWRAVFALAQMYVEQSQDVAHIADKLLQSLAAVVDDICIEGIEPSRIHNQWRLVHLYIESVQEIVESSTTLTLSEYKLFGSCLGKLLRSSACRDQDMRAILSLLQTVLSRQRIATKKAKQQGEEVSSTVTTQQKNLCEVLWRTFYDFIKVHSTTLTPPSQLADAAAGFTLLTLDLPLSSQVESFMQCFQYFAFNENVNANISCRYLSHLLPNQSAMDRLGLDLPNPGAALIRAWFRCAWQLPDTNEQMQELTRLIMKMREVQDVFTQSGINTDDTEDAQIVNFIKALGIIFSGKTDFQSKLKFQKTVLEYFGDVTKHLGAALRSQGTSELRATYRMGGAICKYCAHVIYVKSNTKCLFPELLERLVLPRSLLNQKKPPPQSLLTAIRENLHMFVEGFSHLGLKNDPYLQRKLKAIFHQYLTKFPVKSSTYGALSVHPLLLSLNDSCGRVPTDQAAGFRAHVLEILCSDYLLLPRSGAPPGGAAGGGPSPGADGKGTAKRLQIALTFVNELIDRTLDTEQVSRDSDQLLTRCLEIMLMCDLSAIKQEATRCAQLLLEALKQYPETVPRDVIMQKLNRFIEETVKLYQVKALKVLETVAVLNPELLAQCIGTMSAAIKSSESKRGVGVDKQLRGTYFQILQHLGEKGRAEKQGLIREAEFS